MTPNQTLHKFVSKDLTAKWADPVLKAVLAAIKEYARQQVKAAPKKNVRHSYVVTLHADDEDVNYFMRVKAYDEEHALYLASDTSMTVVMAERE